MPLRRSRQIRRMFAAIAPRYDLLNHLLSLSVDRYWRRVAARQLMSLLSAGEEQEGRLLVLDLCTGTGDLAFELSSQVQVVGCDFCHPMLELGRQKAADKTQDGVQFVEGDALHLPFPSDCFQGITIAFGLRNLEDHVRGLREMFRVLRLGGVLAILEFSRPNIPVFRQIYGFYFRWILPRIGNWISGDPGAYSYLSQSVREFPDPGALATTIKETGFTQVSWSSLTAGIATLYLARKPERIPTAGA